MILIILSLIIGIYFYPKMPDQIASHWNIQNEVDGYMSRFWGVFLVPIIIIAISALFIFIPKLDPLKKNIVSFQDEFDKFSLIILLFLFYIYLLTLIWNLGIYFSLGKFVIVGVAIIIYYAAILIGKSKRNYFIGIRTPWTLSSDNVWDKTHKLGEKVFKLAAVLMLVSLFIENSFLFILIIILIMVFIPIIYSYRFFREEKLRK